MRHAKQEGHQRGRRSGDAFRMTRYAFELLLLLPPHIAPKMPRMSEARSTEVNLGDKPAPVPSSRVFLRLLKLLRPYWPVIGLGLFLLLLSTPCELFPAIV